MNSADVKSTPALGRYGRPPTLFTVNVTNMTDVEARDALDVLDIPEWTTALESVNLSLNKKRRWDTLDFLKRDIENQQFKEEDFHVHVVERLWMNRRANCEEIISNTDVKKYGSSVFFTSDSLLKRPKPNADISGNGRSTVYFGRKDIRKTSKKDSKVKKKKDTKIEPVVEETTEPQHRELRVEVVRPMEHCVPGTPVTSRRRRERLQRIKETVKSRVGPHYKPKNLNAIYDMHQIEDLTIGLDDWPPAAEDWGSGSDSQQINKKQKKNKRIPKPKAVPMYPTSSLPSLVLFESDSDLTFDLEEEDGEEENLNMCDEYVNATRAPTSFGDLIFSSPKKRENRRRKPNKVNTVLISKKGKLVYKPKEDTITESQVEEIQTDGTSEPEKFEMDVKFQKEDISIKSLSQLFGERYIECGCYPRRFLLDFTGSVRDVSSWLHWPVIYNIRRRRGRQQYKTILKKVRQDVKTAGYLVLEEKRDGQFSLCLETDADLDVEIWKTKLAVPDVSPKGLTDSLCDVLEKNSEKKVIARYADIEARKTDRSLGILRRMLRWPEADSFFPSPFPEVSKVPEKGQQPEEKLEVAESCNICFADIDMTSRDSRGLALNTCGHWFCIGCWKNHVTTCVKNGSTKIMCPEYECEVRVDEGTLTSLLTLDDLRVYRSRIDDITIGTSGSKLYCPKPGCNRIVSLHEESRETGCVQCKCGAEFCIKCRGHAHWPADCSHLRRYQENQRRHGDENVMSWDAGLRAGMKGKRCPECNYFIEKNQGCPMMTCVCGHGFCWQCLKPIATHGFTLECYAKSDNFGTKNIQEVFIEDLNERPQSRSKAYIISLTSRHRQNHRQREMLARYVPKMKKELKELVARQKLQNVRGVPTNKKATRQREEMYRLLDEVETREGMHLLDWVLSLISELHHVIEYSAVLVDIHKDDHRLGNTGSLASTLMYLVERMEVVYQAGVKQDMVSVPTKLMNHANMAVEVLSRLKTLNQYYPKILDE